MKTVMKSGMHIYGVVLISLTTELKKLKKIRLFEA